MRVSLIITTYNWPEALEACLMTALNQTRLPDEIVVADDGSGEATAQCIERIRKIASVPLHHAWQPDEGFRAAAARNRAIAQCHCDYLVMIDGDMLLHPAFIRDHIDAAEEGFFVQGGRVLIDEQRSRELLSSPGCLPSFRDRGISNRKNALHCPFLSRFFSRATAVLSGIKTCNFALFRADALAVNGFDNAFVGWGREDSEFANRLLCAGLKRKTLKFAAVANHCYHPENSRTALEVNDQRLARSIEECLVCCEDGVNRFIKESHES